MTILKFLFAAVVYGILVAIAWWIVGHTAVAPHFGSIVIGLAIIILCLTLDEVAPALSDIANVMRNRNSNT